MWRDFLNSFIAQAQVIGGGGGNNTLIQNPIKVNDLREFIALLLKLVVQIGLPLLVLAFVYVGFLFVSARGNPGKLKEAQQALWTTVLGAAVILGAGVISEAIQLTINNLK